MIVDNPRAHVRLDILGLMTVVLARESSVLDLYADHPLKDGDVVLLLDNERVLEIEGLADHWPQARTGVLHTLQANVRHRVLLAVTRRGADLHGGDHALWADLCTSLADTPIEVLPIQALRC